MKKLPVCLLEKVSLIETGFFLCNLGNDFWHGNNHAFYPVLADVMPRETVVCTLFFKPSQHVDTSYAQKISFPPIFQVEPDTSGFRYSGFHKDFLSLFFQSNRMLLIAFKLDYYRSSVCERERGSLEIKKSVLDRHMLDYGKGEGLIGG